MHTTGNTDCLELQEIITQKRGGDDHFKIMFFLYIKERGRSWLQYYYVNVRRLIEHCFYNTY